MHKTISPNSKSTIKKSANPKQASAALDDLKDMIYHVNQPVLVFEKEGKYTYAMEGLGEYGESNGKWLGHRLVGYVPPNSMESLGDTSFTRDYGIRYPYLCGAMANGIASTDIVAAIGKAGMLGYFGSAGLSPQMVEAAIDRLEKIDGNFPYGFNFIHSPNEADVEAAIADIYIRRGIVKVEASAFLKLTPSIVYYRVHGIHADASGKVITPNRIIAKISRFEVATQFFSPPPEKLLNELVAAGKITAQQARLAETIPMAQDITVEADSGGHTDNQQVVTVLPIMLALRDRMQAKYKYAQGLRVGAAGGIGTPAAAAAVLSMGAAFILTGSVNQCTREAGTSDFVRDMLAQAQQADVTMAPAADMFEMGVKVQVLKRGTMFAMRAAKLYDIYRTYNSLEDIPADIREQVEKSILRESFSSVWASTRTYFLKRDPRQVERGDADAKHRMALVFRWYLGQSSRWANAGDAARKIDYQIWCGPAMGAFNEWCKGSFLEDYRQRDVVAIALNLLYGITVIQRLNVLRQQRVSIPAEWLNASPMEINRIKEYTT